MDDLLAKALERIDALEAELEVLRSFVDSYSRTLNKRESYAQSPDLLAVNGFEPETKKERGEYWKMLIAQTKDILLQFGRPMNRGELVRIIEEKGTRLPGKDKFKVYGTNIWRSGHFIHVEGKGYWPKGYSLEGQSGLSF